MKQFFIRSKYLVYYFLKLDKAKYKKFFQHVKKKYNRNSIMLWKDILSSSYIYNIGLMDYFIFKFYEKSREERKKWVGTGFKYEFDLRMNPKSTRHILEDKIEFYKAYSPFVIHNSCTITDLQEDNQLARQFMEQQRGKIVLKDSMGQCGWDVEIIENKNDRKSLIEYMTSKGFDLIEEYIIQHHELSRLSPSGINTIRIITQLDDHNKVDILGARLRISVDNVVDNLASGNIAAPVNIENGQVNGPGVYSDITKESVSVHPITGVQITDFQIPFWKETIDMVTKAALHRPENRSIGWDVAITASGPELIEGNHNWCKILWQLPVNQGMKHILNKYLA